MSHRHQQETPGDQADYEQTHQSSSFQGILVRRYFREVRKSHVIAEWMRGERCNEVSWEKNIRSKKLANDFRTRKKIGKTIPPVLAKRKAAYAPNIVVYADWKPKFNAIHFSSLDMVDFYPAPVSLKLTGYKQGVLDAHSHLYPLHYMMEVSHPEEQGAHEYGSSRCEALQEQRQHASSESPFLG